jgi:hypothetical protein
MENEFVYLEHTDKKLYYAHSADKCKGPTCTVHKRSNHKLRHLPQNWRADRHFMERLCSHGVGHPDPDEFMFDVWIHGCDGCCERGDNE